MTDDSSETDETQRTARTETNETDSQSQSNSAPLSDLASRVADRETQTQRGSVDELFESIEVDELDDDVWTALVESGDDESGVGVGAEATPVDEDELGVEHVVPKESFCQRCEYFETPPTFGCSHEGTKIVEAVDSDHFRVHNCPMVDRDAE